MWINIIFLFFIETATSQIFTNLKFSHLTDKDGLSNNNVMSIAAGQDGIIWIGTENGLNRFDGYGFKIFNPGPDIHHTIPNGFISQIIPDRKNNLWISTPEGIFYLNTKTRNATVYGTVPNDTNTFRDQHRPIIFLDSNQLPWVCTYDGVYHFRDSIHYEKTNKGITAYTHFTNKKSNIYCEFVKDKKGGLWRFWDNSIFQVDPDTKELMHIFKCPDQILIRQIFFDSHNRCWVSTWGNGIYLFDPLQNEWQFFNPSKGRTVVYGAAEWEISGVKTLVFSCSTPGLLFVNEENLSASSYNFDAYRVDLTGPPYVDNQNILWVISRDGIYYTTPSNNLFSIISIPPVDSIMMKKKPSYIYNMREEPSGYWISKRYFGGIYWYDNKWNLIKSWSQIPVGEGKKFAGIGITSSEGYDFKQVGNEMYVTTEAGISILNLHTLEWTSCIPNDITSAPRLRNIVEENEQSWWIRSFDQGVFIFNPLTRQFLKHFKNEDSCTECLSGHINYLLRDKKQRVFAATSNGLFKYDKQRDHFTRIKMVDEPKPTKFLFGLAEDGSGMIWLGAENGLFEFNPDNNKIEKALSENNKIGIVYRICADDKQNIWFVSNTGYWCWLKNPDKVIDFEYSAYLPRTDGGIFYKTSDGSIYGGGEEAVIRFYPELLMNYKISARTKIMEAEIYDSLIPFTLNSAGEKELTISQNENNIQINFDVINYDLPSSNQFYYKITPGNNQWRQTENGHLSFYSLQPGQYKLEVKGANKLAGNFTNTDSLNIIVKKFWYQTGWFKFICILLGCIIISLIVRYRFQLIRKEGQTNQRIAKIEMSALRAQMSPHFIFNSLNSIENFMMQNEKVLAIDYLNKFASLIRMILENSRQQVVPIAKDMEAMQLYIDLEKLRFEDKFRYLTDIDNILLVGDYRIPPLLIQPFVENAIIHGIAPSERNDLYLSISVKYYTDYIQYIIEDNGIGRLASMRYTVKRNNGHKSLGLQISQERIDIINRKNKDDVTLEIVDLYDEVKNPAGTRVILNLKLS
ncbi:MAG TPA: histidine kinase [Puia sp.]|nr:histidine kinase [Puia sp.]